MFGHVMSLLRPGGLAIVLNQNEAERDAQQALIEGAGLEYTTREVTFELWAVERPRFVHVIHSNADSAG